MEAIRYQNYRCIEDSGFISIKPITFLLGANSTGKSSFLKFFPLLKQSLQTNTSGQFLWYGDDVDFGDFRNTLMDGKRSMTISFKINEIQTIRPYFTINTIYSLPQLKNLIVNVTLSLDETKNTDYLSQLQISYSGFEIIIKYNNRAKVETIGVNAVFAPKELVDNFKLVYRKQEFLPNIIYSKGEQTLFDSFENTISNWHTLKSTVLSNQEKEEIQKIENKLIQRINNRENLKRSIRSFASDADKQYVDEICDTFLLGHINLIIEAINYHISDFSQNIQYIQPLRAMSQRYYRYSNVDINELDSDGKNLPMFFNSLNDKQKGAFNTWLSTNWGITLEPKNIAGFIELYVKEGNKKERNLIDLGFGYTQCLPIISMIWKTLHFRRMNPFWGHGSVETLIAIEQPELHLHPRFQGMFAEMLVSTISDCKENNKNVRFLIETHSETIITRIGELIGEKRLASDEVNVVIFNDNNYSEKKQIYSTQFDDNGMIKDWPYDFFTHYVN